MTEIKATREGDGVNMGVRISGSYPDIVIEGVAIFTTLLDNVAQMEEEDEKAFLGAVLEVIEKHVGKKAKGGDGYA